MKRILSILLCLVVCMAMMPVGEVFAAEGAADTDVPGGSGTEPIAINETNFPDATFRDYVSKEFDKDNDGKLTPEEISEATNISCHSNGESLKSLQGVEYFTELTSLVCYGNALTALDVSQNTKLQILTCSKNQLTTLDLGKNTELLKLFCNENGLADLDIKKNTKLLVLNCSGNQLSTLDISKNTALTSLICRDNQLTELDLSKNTALEDLNCKNNWLVCLDLSENVNIKSLDTEGNARSITVGADRTFDLSTIKGFEVSNASGWEGGSVSGNILTVNESAAVVMYTYKCNDKHNVSFVLLIEGAAAKTIAIDETNFPDANFRECITAQGYDRNQDGNLSEGELALVKTMDLYGEQISDLTGIEHFTELKELSCDGNMLTALDVSRNTKLEELDCSRNQLTSLDISANTALTTFVCDGNTYTLPLAEGANTFDLSGLLGFVISKASNWQGGSVSDNTLTIDDDAEEVTYTYDCGNSKTAEFTLNLPSLGKVAAPVFSPNGGSFIGTQEVTIKCTTAGATIHYSIDGGNSYNEYTDPITLTDTTTIAAYATKTRMNVSDTVDVTFTKTTPGGSAGGGAIEDDVKTNTDGTTSETTTSTTVRETKTETVKDETGKDVTKTTATVSDKVADKLVDQAVSNNSDTVEITVKSDDGNKADSEKQIELEIPKSAVKDIADKTDASLVINTDNGQVVLDNKTLETIASETEGDTVRIVVYENTQLKESQEPAADVIKSGRLFDISAYIGSKRIHDLRGGMATVMLPIPEKLKGKDVVVIYINDKGICEILNHTMEEIGADSYIRFTTSHFSTFAVVESADAERIIARQNQDKAKDLFKEAKLKASTAKTAKKNVKITVKADNSLIKELKDMGYTVKYKFYRSTKKASKYSAVKTKTTNTYINTRGKKGTRYYYKARVLVYDGKKLIAQTELKQCSYGARVWSK